MISRSLLPAFVLGTLIACSSPAPIPDDSTGEASTAERPDPHSYSRPDQVTVTHLDLDLDVDFERKVLDGTATLDLDRHDLTAPLLLDIRGLEIHEVTANGDATTFELGAEDPFLGQELRIDLPEGAQQVTVRYTSSPDAAAVQWLEPAQTAGKAHPFLFTQSQAVLARTWVPCQDSPGVRFTYDATIRVPSDLLALMSAENPTERSADGTYSFHMPQAIPSYLMALSVGDLEFREIGPRTGVYAEPSLVEAAAWEFAETQEMLDRVEELYGPYRWGRYDLLVLPPSFPFGGMENPRLTFATPTIMAGDRSLVALVAHELAHSWSGNLVTNSNWNDFWLNEGFTVYLERRIMELLHGRSYSEMLALLGHQDLEATVADIGPTAADTHLRLDLEGRDPDDGMTDIAYEKGYSFLRLLEETVGREPWDAFLRGWFEDRAFRPTSTDDFLQYLDDELLKDMSDEQKNALQISAWVDGPGLPSNDPLPVSDRFESVEASLDSWVSGTTKAADLATSEWTTHEWLHFIRALPESMSIEQMADLDSAFSFTNSGNSEIVHAWFHHVIANDYEPGIPALEEFLTSVGRRKFLKPLYERMAGDERWKDRALVIYEKARPGYHSVSSTTIDAILGWSPPEAS